MAKIKFVGLFVLLATTSLYAKDISIVTDKSTIDGNLKVNVLSHPKYDYESIDMYQENKTGKSALLGNYKKGELDNTTIALNTAYKQSVLKGVINSPKIVNEGSEVYIKTNLAYYTIEGSPIDWGYLFSGLGEPSKLVWTVTSYNENNVETLKNIYTTETSPKTLGVGTHIVDLEYYDLYGTKFENSKTIKVAKKVVYTSNINIASEFEDKTDINWSYSFNGIAKKVNWYIDGELQIEPPKKLKEGTYNIRLEILDELGELHTKTKDIKVTHIASLDDLIKGSFPNGTKISTNVGTCDGNINNLLIPSFYHKWVTTSMSGIIITLEFPYPIDISMFEVGKGATPDCTQTITYTGLKSDGSTSATGSWIFNSYSIEPNISFLQNPDKLYSSWENFEIKNCKKLVLNFNANKSWGCLFHIGVGYTESNASIK